jgi:hypothetical protein
MAQLAALVTHDVGLDSLPGEKFRQILQYWLDARGDLDLPPVAAIDPVRFPRGTLGGFSLISIEEGPPRFRYRLVGTAIILAWGEDFTGRFVEEARHGREIVARLNVCAKTGRPYYSQGPFKYGVNDFKSYGVLVMPFGGPDGVVSRFLAYHEFA